LAERYTETERSQHINHNDPRIYGQSYVANTSSCDGKRAFLDQESQHDHVEYFQGFSKFREMGLPHALPAEIEASLEYDLKLVGLNNHLQQLITKGAAVKEVKRAKTQVRTCYERLKNAKLREYQDRWGLNRPPLRQKVGSQMWTPQFSK
jgi:Protein of unknown function (DUF3435)